MLLKITSLLVVTFISLSQSVVIEQNDLSFAGKKLYKVSSMRNSGSDCGNAASDVIHFKGLSTSPDYIPVPGNLTLTTFFDVDSDLEAPIAMNLTMTKQVSVIWISIPCVKSFGSCSYEDACELMPNADKPDSEPCPDEFKALSVPCKCPILKHTFALQNVPLQVKQPNADFNFSGTYKLEVVFSKQDGTQLGCLDLDFKVEEYN